MRTIRVNDVRISAIDTRSHSLAATMNRAMTSSSVAIIPVGVPDLHR
jgi:hypothetical protein